MGAQKLPFWSIWEINARYISCYSSVSGELIRLRNRPNLVDRSLFAIIDLLQGAKFIFLHFKWRVG